MPDTPQQQVRKAIAITVVDEMAERLLQHDKANPAYKMVNLRSDDERKVYRDAILEFLASPSGRTLRANKINTLRGHGFAMADDENERVAAQARRDIERYGTHGPVPSHFGSVRPGYCWICRLAVGPLNGSTLHLTDSLIVDIHNDCGMKDERCIPVSKVSFILKGGL